MPRGTAEISLNRLLKIILFVKKKYLTIGSERAIIPQVSSKSA